MFDYFAHAGHDHDETTTDDTHINEQAAQSTVKTATHTEQPSESKEERSTVDPVLVGASIVFSGVVIIALIFAFFSKNSKLGKK